MDRDTDPSLQFGNIYPPVKGKSLLIQAILLLDFYSTDILMHVQKDSCARLFIV